MMRALLYILLGLLLKHGRVGQHRYILEWHRESLVEWRRP